MSVTRIARTTAFLLIASLAAWALYFVIVGLPSTGYSAVPPGQPLPPGQTIYEPYYPALYSTLPLLLIFIGLLRDRWLRLAWLGVVLLLALGALLIFTLGIFHIAAAGLLAFLVAVVHWQASGRAHWLLASAAGAGLVLLIGCVMLGSIYGYPTLALGLLLAAVLLALRLYQPHAAPNANP